MFEIDINSKYNNTIPISEEIEKILLELDDEDIYKIGNELIPLKTIKALFKKIYKDVNLKILLSEYFKKSINLVNKFEKLLDLEYIRFNKPALERAKNILMNNVIGVNDAEHISVAENQGCKYILTLDGDFKYIESNLVILKI